MLQTQSPQPLPTTFRSKFWSLGIDGGRTGAAVLVSPSFEAKAIITWTYRKRKSGKIYCIENHLISEKKEVKFPWQIGYEIKRRLAVAGAFALVENDMIISSEDIYVGRNAKTSITLARFCGAVVSQVEAFDRSGEAVWVRAEQWRRELLGLNSFTKRADAKAASIKLVPQLVSGLDYKNLSSLDHVTDAAGIAVWGLKTR
jgi:hypothetical protein